MPSKKTVLLMVAAIPFLVACSDSSQSRAQGYIEGRYTYMATNVSGVLKEWRVERGARVKQGQVLFVLEAEPESDAYEAAIEKWKASIYSRDVTIANLNYAKITYDRYKVLVPKNAIERSQLDQAKSSYIGLQSQLKQANATISENAAWMVQAEWTKNQKIISAPVNAIVFDTYYRQGEYTIANKPIVSLLAPNDIKAIFYVPETVLGKIKLNDLVRIHCDGCSTAYPARISFISPSAEYTPPVIYSETTSEKLIYRIEAAIDPAEAYHLHPGQPVIITYSF